MDNIIQLMLNAGFNEGVTGMFYTVIDGFIYTVTIPTNNEIVYAVNLPKITKGEQEAVSDYIKSHFSEAKKISLNKSGVLMYFPFEAFEHPEKIIKKSEKLSAYLSSIEIEFDEISSHITPLSKRMYSFISTKRRSENTDISKNNIFSFNAFDDMLDEADFTSDFSNTPEQFEVEKSNEYDNANYFDTEDVLASEEEVSSTKSQKNKQDEKIGVIKYETPETVKQIKKTDVEVSEIIEIKDEIIPVEEASSAPKKEAMRFVQPEKFSPSKKEKKSKQVKVAESFEHIEDAPKKKTNSFISFLSSNTVIVFALAAILFFALSMIYIKSAAVVGYVIGVGVTYLFIIRKEKHIFLKASCYSLLTLCIAGVAVFLYSFLSQRELYSIYEYCSQSLTLVQCVFNVIFGLILAMFGIYSSLPSKKQHSDF